MSKRKGYKHHFTRDQLAPMIAESTSLAQVLAALEISPSGGGYQALKSAIQEHGIDTSHFLGKTTNRGTKHTGGSPKREWIEILVLGAPGTRRIEAFRLRRALRESGRDYHCEACGLGGEWQGKPLHLEVDHINGHHYDNRPENLRYLCPNCHSQTPTYGSQSNGNRYAYRRIHG